MISIDLKDAVVLLKKAEAVIWGDFNHLTFLSPSCFKDDPNSIFLNLFDNGSWAHSFMEGNNKYVAVEGNSMYLFDTHGVRVKIQLLTKMKLD